MQSIEHPLCSMLAFTFFVLFAESAWIKRLRLFLLKSSVSVPVAKNDVALLVNQWNC